MIEENQVSRCNEKGCPFLAEPGSNLCAHHIDMFAFEGFGDDQTVSRSDSSQRRNGIPLTPAINLEILSGHVFVETGLDRWRRSIEEHEEIKGFEKHVRAAYSNRRRKSLRKSELCLSCGRPRDAATQLCAECNRQHLKRIANRKADWRRRGLCCKCGNEISTPGFVRCYDCREKNRRYLRKRKKKLGTSSRSRKYVVSERAKAKKIAFNQRRRRRWKSRGLCVRCGKRARDGRVLCASCTKKDRCRYRLARNSKFCPGCRGPRDREGKIYCTKCAAKQRNWQRERVESGMCRKCGAPRDSDGTNSLCSSCAREKRSVYEQRKLSGVCVACGGEKDDMTKTRCAKCRKAYQRSQRPPSPKNFAA